MELDRIYGKSAQAGLRARKLERDGFVTEIRKSTAGWAVWSAKPTPEPEPVFGMFMEMPEIVEQLLDVDPAVAEAPSLDIGETHARPATALLGQPNTRAPLTLNPDWVPPSPGRRMTPRELRDAELAE